MFIIDFAKSHNRNVLFITLLTILGYVLRVWLAGNSVPYIPDTQIVREALNVGISLSNADFIDTTTTLKYPLVMPSLLLLAYGVFYSVGSLLGWFASLAEFEAYLFANVTTFHLIAIWIGAAFNALTIPIVFDLGRKLFSERVGWVLALLFCFDLINVQFSHQARPHAVVTFFFVFALWASYKLLHKPSAYLYAFSFGLAALAAGTLHNGFIAYAYPVMVHVWLVFKKERGLFEIRCLGALLICLIILLATYPQLLFAPETFLTMNDQGQILLSGYHDVDRASFLVSRVPARFRTVWLHAIPIVIMAGIALIQLSVSQIKDRFFIWGISIVAIGYFLVFSPFDHTESRFFAPLMPMLILMSGVFLHSIERYALLFQTVVVISLGVGMALVFRFDQLSTRTDTRDVATNWLLQLDSLTPVVLERELDVALTEQSLLKQAEYAPDSLGTKDRFQLANPDSGFDKLNAHRNWIYQWQTLDDVATTLVEANAVHIISFYETEFVELPPLVQSSPPELLIDTMYFRASDQDTGLSASEFPLDMVNPWIMFQIERPGPLVISHTLELPEVE